jgi:tRNA(Ile)-lysidine synthase
MDGFLQQLRRHWAERFGGEPRHLVIAVSGGLDSMVLLHALARLRRKFPWELTVAHAHHGLRGAEADGDADWVRSQAGSVGLPCVVERLPVRTAARASKESLEMAARRLRHDFLARTALAVGSTEVVLAHHAHDQAELILLRLLRGAGSEGLAGMKERAASPSDRRVSLLRPFLGFERSSLESFARREAIGHREDATNQDLSIPRNRIRHRLIPDWVAHYSPALPRVLARIADIASHEADYLREQAQRWRASTDPQPWEELHVALQRAILRLDLIENGQEADFDQVESLRRRRAAAPHSPAVPHIPATGLSPNPPTGRRPTHRGEAKPGAAQSEFVDVSFSGAQGTRELPDGGRLLWKRLRRPLPFGQGWEQFDAGTLPETATLRHRRPGDRFQRLGQSAAARLQNLFINQRIPAGERSRRWVLDPGRGTLAWVEGFPAGEAHRLGPATREILALRIESAEERNRSTQNPAGLPGPV